MADFILSQADGGQAVDGVDESDGSIRMRRQAQRISRRLRYELAEYDVVKRESQMYVRSLWTDQYRQMM